jgi:hypothetical protein
MKICLLTLVIGDQYYDSVKLGIESKKKYCESNGYDFILGDNKIYDKKRPIAWSKIKMIQKYINNYDYIFCSDADVIIMNSNHKLETFINKYLGQNKKLLVTRDFMNINTGNIILKNCSEIISLLDNIYNQTQFLNHNWWEQMAFIDLYNKSKLIRDFTFVLNETHLINAYIIEFPNHPLPESNKYRTGDFLIHLAGIDNFKDLKNLMEMCYDINKKEKEENFNNYVTIKLKI